jgi:hypothetical protein
MDLLKWLPALLLLGCVPDLDTDEATVVKPRILAIQAEPAEAAPNSSTHYRALVADGSGVRADVPLTWFQCLAQKPLAELGPISEDCLNTDSGKLVEFANGQEAQGTLPSSACSLFGPNPPLPMPGEPAGRPVDPDQTGGYKAPLIVALNGDVGPEVTLYEQRIYCGLASVSPDVSVQFATRYHANSNPSIAELHVVRADGSDSVLGDTLQLAPNERVELDVLWQTCPESDACGDHVCGPDETASACASDCQPLSGCGGQERYLIYDRRKTELTVQREAMRIAWYATSGRYDDERTGVDGDTAADGARNFYRAPQAATTGTLWLVLRDSRGGVGYRALSLVVR